MRQLFKRLAITLQPMVNHMMTIYATSAVMARQFGFTHSQVLSTIENLSMPEILDRHLEIFDFGVSKIAQMSEIGFNAVALNLPMNAGGDDALLLRWKEGLLSQHVTIHPALTVSSLPASHQPAKHEQASNNCQFKIQNKDLGVSTPRLATPNTQTFIKITEPGEFVSLINGIMVNISDFMALTQERNLGIKPTIISDNHNKTFMDLAKEYYRPDEFLQALLDIIRANFEPNALSSLQLNSNIDLLFNAIPKQPFGFGYFSLTSEGVRDFKNFWTQAVVPHTQNCGYNVNTVTALILVVTAGHERHHLNWLDEVLIPLHAGYTVNEALALIKSSLENEKIDMANNTLVGFCWDEALTNKIRISGWLVKNSLHTDYPLN